MEFVSTKFRNANDLPLSTSLHRSEQRSGTSPPPTTTVAPPLPPTPLNGHPTSPGSSVGEQSSSSNQNGSNNGQTVANGTNAAGSVVTPTGATTSPTAHLPLGPGPLPPTPDEKHEEALPRYKRDLVAKIKILRTELQTMQPQSGHCRLEVSRGEIFEVFSLISQLSIAY